MTVGRTCEVHEPLCQISKPDVSNLHLRTHQVPRQERKMRHRHRICVECWAKRVSKEEAAAGEWAVLLQEEESNVDEDGGITAERLNQICNKGVKLMLREDTAGLVDFQEELNATGQTFSDRGNLDGALFVYVLFKMCDNILVEQTTNLKGVYLEAFGKVFNILEDSGWLLKPEAEVEDGEAPRSLDDLPNLPYMQEL